MEKLESGADISAVGCRQNQHDNDPWIDLRNFMSLQVTKVPDVLHPVQDGTTRASSFFAVTGHDPRSGAIASTVSLSAVVGASSRYYLETIVQRDPEFFFMWMSGRSMVAYPEPFTQAWNDRKERIKREQLERAGAALLWYISGPHG